MMGVPCSLTLGMERSGKLVLGSHDNDELGIVCTLVESLLCISEGITALPDTLFLVERARMAADRGVQDIVPLIFQLISELIQEHQQHCALLNVVERHPVQHKRIRSIDRDRSREWGG